MAIKEFGVLQIKINNMKITTLIALTLILSAGAMAQSKPRKVTIKKSVTISKDSIYYLPDTIACVFKELIIKPDTVYEKWNRGFVVWQVWNAPIMYISNGFGMGSGTWGGVNSGIQEVQPYKNDYDFSDTMQGKFLYQNHQPVPNKVITAYKP